tara:strand:- start:375 stop:569 length:195 start_codon:yes stop_codon:yes gene_type:complete
MASRDWELAGAACEASSCEWAFTVRKLSAMAERLRLDLMRLVHFIVFISENRGVLVVIETHYHQ